MFREVGVVGSETKTRTLAGSVEFQTATANGILDLEPAARELGNLESELSGQRPNLAGPSVGPKFGSRTNSSGASSTYVTIPWGSKEPRPASQPGSLIVYFSPRIILHDEIRPLDSCVRRRTSLVLGKKNKHDS